MNEQAASGHGSTDGEPGQPGSDKPPSTAGASVIRVHLDVSVDAGDWSSIANAEELVEAAGRTAAEFVDARLQGTCAAVSLSNDETVAGLNATYRGQSKPTNVLSFPASGFPTAADSEPRFIGDIILAAETVMSEARDQGIPAANHLQHLIVHGLLHLTGFDHETDAAAKDMEALETRILAALGIPDPYADAAVA